MKTWEHCVLTFWLPINDEAEKAKMEQQLDEWGAKGYQIASMVGTDTQLIITMKKAKVSRHGPLPEADVWDEVPVT